MPPLIPRPCCIDKTGVKTKVASVVLALAIHFLLGSLFNYTSEDNVQRFHYPNLGSSLFVLSVALYCTTRSLHPKSLCIHSGVLQAVYKVVMVLIICNVLLVTVWQQLVSLSVELVLILHDILSYCRAPCGCLVERTGCYLSHLIGFLMLAWVLTNMKCLFLCKPKEALVPPPPSSEPQDPYVTSMSPDFSDDSMDSYFASYNEND